MQIRTGEVSFETIRKGDDISDGAQLTGGDFPRFKLVEINGFEVPIISPVALLTGFDVAFEEGDGRPFGHLDIRVEVEDVFDSTVTVRVTYGLRDWSGDWDDEHGGNVRFSVLAA